MSKTVLIACDSTCDLGAELIERYQIELIPMGINLNEKHYLDGIDIDPDRIYAVYEQSGILPQTSAINIAEYEDFFAKHTAQGRSIVLFSISSEISSSYQNACLAAEEFDDVFVVDTRNLSSGSGLLAVAASEMAKEGLSAKEIAETCCSMRSRVDVSFVIDSLEFLHKGGRCSALTVLGANLLNVKPCIIVQDGRMAVGKKYRGKFDHVLKQYIADRLADPSDIDLDRIFVTHAGCDEALCQACVELVRSTAPFREVFLTRAGCTVSSHCGRNTLGIIFLRKKAPVGVS